MPDNEKAPPEPVCLNVGPGCAGPTEYRESLSGTGTAIPRCDEHWAERLKLQDDINHRYPVRAPADWSPLDAGESWDED